MRKRISILNFLLRILVILFLQACYTQFAFYGETDTQSEANTAERKGKENNQFEKKDAKQPQKITKRRSEKQKKRYADRKNVAKKDAGQKKKKKIAPQPVLMAAKESKRENKKPSITTNPQKLSTSFKKRASNPADASKNAEKAKTIKKADEQPLKTAAKKGERKNAYQISEPVVMVDRDRSLKPQRKKVYQQWQSVGKISLDIILNHSASERGRNLFRGDILRKRLGRSRNQLSGHKTNARH